MKKITTLLFLLCLLVCTFVFTACGNNNTATDEEIAQTGFEKCLEAYKEKISSIPTME